MSKDLDVWFYSLDLEQLAKIFHWENRWGPYEFIEQCYEYWRDMDASEREWMYEKYSV